LLFPSVDEILILLGRRKIAVVKKIANQYQDIDAVLSSSPPPAIAAAMNDAKQNVLCIFLFIVLSPVETFLRQQGLQTILCSGNLLRF